jgi:hypothetical protein
MCHVPIVVKTRKKPPKKSRFMSDAEVIEYAMSFGFTIEEIREEMSLAQIGLPVSPRNGRQIIHISREDDEH